MKYNPDVHHRQSIRLKAYDYSQTGLCFITICTQNRLCLFGKIENGIMLLNDAGGMIEKQWQALMKRFSNMQSEEYVVMPNHIHGIIKLTVGAPLVGAQIVDVPYKADIQTCSQPQKGQPQGIAPTVGDIVGAFKSITTNQYIRGVQQNKWSRFDKKLWQRNYYEHIIRDDKSYLKISDYIQTNPSKWLEDRYYE